MHIVCHMAASVDGRLHPSRWSPFVEDCSVGGVYEEVANQYDYVGWMIGRVTMAEYSEAITESEPAKLRPAAAAPAQGIKVCLLYTSPSPRDPKTSRMPSSA